MLKRTIALTTAGTMLAGTAAALVAAPAHADGPEKNAYGSVGSARYEISVEKERRFEINADLDGVPAGSSWKVVVRHDGKRVGSQTADAVRDDGRYEVDFHDFHSADTAGKDTFKVTIKRTDGAGKVTRTLTFRS
ncbi:hypothetical protein ABLE68_16625 [Nocardioides sp. CN2-186]|uniref:hypothetical protein n=1 Tax=Nocardioides tweenelious TaxID=3156607 RepID=UPI0032B53190